MFLLDLRSFISLFLDYIDQRRPYVRKTYVKNTHFPYYNVVSVIINKNDENAFNDIRINNVI